jgi:hypothetical protein
MKLSKTDNGLYTRSEGYDFRHPNYQLLTTDELRSHPLVQQLIAEALEAERDDNGAKFFDAQAPGNSY